MTQASSKLLSCVTIKAVRHSKYILPVNKLRDARKKVKESSEIELLEILNERQKKKLKELFGTKFTVD